jgi:hypothetical protein
LLKATPVLDTDKFRYSTAVALDIGLSLGWWLWLFSRFFNIISSLINSSIFSSTLVSDFSMLLSFELIPGIPR